MGSSEIVRPTLKSVEVKSESVERDALIYYVRIQSLFIDDTSDIYGIANSKTCNIDGMVWLGINDYVLFSGN